MKTFHPVDTLPRRRVCNRGRKAADLCCPIFCFYFDFIVISYTFLGFKIQKVTAQKYPYTIYLSHRVLPQSQWDSFLYHLDFCLLHM
jgi:hypothetical protein